MTKLKATLIHLGISSVIATAVIAVMTFVWYPPPLFNILGGYGLLWLIAGIDVVLGPMLTFIVFKPGKKMLKLDLVVIALCQLAALGYGVFVIAEVRPAYVVFVKDRFELVRAFDITAKHFSEAVLAEFSAAPWTGPKQIGVVFPTDAKEQMALIDSSLAGGADIHLLPKYFASLNRSKGEIARKSQPLDVLSGFNPTRISEIDDLPISLGKPRAQLGFLPLRAIRADVTAIVDRRSGDVLKIIELAPW